MGTRYRTNEPRFVDETVDGEALVMDMVRGNYYSCDGASAVVFNGLKQGLDADAAADLLVGAYGIAPEQAATDVAAFVATLLAEELFVEAADREAPSTPVGPAPAPTGTYDGLRLERFTDLADLILLDPVHDVSEAGWPHRAE